MHLLRYLFPARHAHLNVSNSGTKIDLSRKNKENFWDLIILGGEIETWERVLVTRGGNELSKVIKTKARTGFLGAGNNSICCK